MEFLSTQGDSGGSHGISLFCHKKKSESRNVVEKKIGFSEPKNVIFNIQSVLFSLNVGSGTEIIGRDSPNLKNSKTGTPASGILGLKLSKPWIS